MILKVMNYICIFIICTFCFGIFSINNSFAQGVLNLKEGGTHINNTNLSGADYAIEGSTSKVLTVTNNANLTANRYDGMWNCCSVATTFINNGTISAPRNGIGQWGGEVLYHLQILEQLLVQEHQMDMELEYIALEVVHMLIQETYLEERV